MKSRTLFIFLFALIGLSFSYSQSLPSYAERSLHLLPDSLKSANALIDASGGLIDPSEYKLGPGDRIFISISGISEILHALIIDHEGYLYIPSVGSVNLSNTMLDAGKKIILEKLNKYYKDVDIYISLAQFRTIKVSLIGDVNKPGTFLVKSNSRLLDVLRISEGLSSTANYRNILVKSINSLSKKFDLLKFLRFGDYSQNPYMNEGDVIIIDKADKLVFISGEVKYPAAYEYLDHESANELIRISGDFLTKARIDSIEIVRFADDGKSQFSNYYSYEQILSSDIKLKNLDHVIIREIPEYLINQFVRIEGKVKYPGWYKIKKNETSLLKIIEESGGFLDDASLVDSYVLRSAESAIVDVEYERLKSLSRADMTDDEYDYLKSKSRQRSGKVIVDFQKLFEQNQMSEDLVLKKNDYIFISEAKNYITLIGQVVNPGKLIYRPELNVDGYIELAGGFGWRAIENDVRVIKANTGEWQDADDVEQLEPGDTIWVPEDPPGPKFWDVFITSLNVLGQVATVVAATIAVIVATR